MGLHIHPDQLGFKTIKPGELGYESQKEVISESKKVLEDLIDKKILSFRAGRHSVSEDTLESPVN